MAYLRSVLTQSSFNTHPAEASRSITWDMLAGPMPVPSTVDLILFLQVYLCYCHRDLETLFLQPKQWSKWKGSFLLWDREKEDKPW